MLIKNYNVLNKNPQRKICLDLIEVALLSIQPENVIPKNFSLNGDILTIQDKIFDLKNFERVFLLGFGKGSAGLSKKIEEILGNKITLGLVIDLEPQSFSRIEFTLGSHPLPSEQNFTFTQKSIQQFNNLTIKDLIIVVIAGGGSAMLVNPYKISLEKLIETNKQLLKSGANITEMNIVRKHLDIVKGGGLAKLFFPARIVATISSDVPGNDLSTIASGPTVKDATTKEQAFEILKKYNLFEQFSVDDFLETPKDEKYFTNTTTILMLSNQTALHAMEQKAKELGYKTIILTDKFQNEAKFAGKKLIDQTPPNTILLAGGETTVKVTKKGKGGRNQELVLGALPNI
ncbi:MAG: DUF4147 domain-containing protein, partial [Candidatus Diapherotrites archaeon]|nr:DUF4147 domain-containing protein [Candidatus Diapherotrites archaeon]